MVITRCAIEAHRLFARRDHEGLVVFCQDELLSFLLNSHGKVRITPLNLEYSEA
jgi:hypothetical protein